LKAACAALLLLLAAGGGTDIVGPRLANRLVQSLPIARCNLMVVLGGGVRERVDTAVDLLLAGACERLLLTGTDLSADARELLAESAGSGVRYEIEVAGSRSTLEDAVVSLRAARSAGIRSVLVVTSPYHTRRAAWIFSRVFAGTGVEFGIHPSECFYFDYGRWWKSRDGRGAVLGEYAKLLLYGTLSDLLTGWVASLV
jgi:uncharacterized SAM-binding protein YcdF (DUF218 family)